MPLVTSLTLSDFGDLTAFQSNLELFVTHSGADPADIETAQDAYSLIQTTTANPLHDKSALQQRLLQLALRNPKIAEVFMRALALKSSPVSHHTQRFATRPALALTTSGSSSPLQSTRFGTFTQEELDYFKKLPRNAQLRLVPLFEGLHKAHVSDDLRRVLVPLILRLPECQSKREVRELLFQQKGDTNLVRRDLYSNLPMWEKTGFDLVQQQHPDLQHFFEALSKSDIPLPEQREVVRTLIQQTANSFLPARSQQNTTWLLPLVNIVDPTLLNPYFIRDGQLLVFQNAKNLAAYLRGVFSDPQTLTASNQPAEKTRYWENGIVVQTRPQDSFLSPETDDDSLKYPLLVQQGRLSVYPPHVYAMIPGYIPQRETGGDEFYIVYIFSLDYRLIQVRISSRSWGEMAQTGFGTNIQFNYMSGGRRDIQIYPPPR